MTLVTLPDLYTNCEGFQALNHLAAAALARPDEKLFINIGGWVDANMCAPLGAILTLLRSRDIHGGMKVLQDRTRSALQMNDFLSAFMDVSKADAYNTTIKYRLFGADESSADEFKRYINDSFQSGVKGLPQMSDPLLKEFRKSLFELYNNAVEHAESVLGVITCGQYFPQKRKLHFSIADLGIGIRSRIQHSTGMLYNDEAAIEWAVSGNTTRTGPRPGGLGLRLLREFITLNQGRLIIVSGSGYWRQKGEAVRKQMFGHPFPGTVVTMVINTSDPAAYGLSSEIDVNQIF